MMELQTNPANCHTSPNNSSQETLSNPPISLFKLEPIPPTSAEPSNRLHTIISPLPCIKYERIPPVFAAFPLLQPLPPPLSQHRIKQELPPQFRSGISYSTQPFPFQQNLIFPIGNNAQTIVQPVLFNTHSNNLIDEHAIFDLKSVKSDNVKHSRKRKRKSESEKDRFSDSDLSDFDTAHISNVISKPLEKRQRVGSDRLQCSECNASFVQRCHLQRHIREKHAVCKPTFECKVCSKAFYQRSNLKVHLRSHAADKRVSHPWLCTECYPNKEFTRKSSLKRHVIKKHKKVSAQLLAQMEQSTENVNTHLESVKDEQSEFELPPDVNVTTNYLDIPPALD